MSQRCSISHSLASLLLATGMAACGDGSGSGSGPGPSVQAFLISGTLSNWIDGEGSFVKAYSFLGIGTGATSDVPFASAPIDKTGSFKISLPEGADLAPWLSTVSAPANTQPGCTSTITYSPMTVGYVALELRVVSPTTSITDKIFYRIPAGASSSTQVGYIYVDRDFSQVGESSCTIAPGFTMKSVYDLRYKKGWNTAISSTETTVGGATTTTDKSGPPPANAYWTSRLF